MKPQVDPVKELLAQQRLHQIEAADNLHPLVPVPDLSHRADQVRAELRRSRPGQVGPAARDHILRDAVEQCRELVILVRPERGEDVIGPPAEQQCVGAFVGGRHLPAGHLVHQRRLPATEREADRILLGAAGPLPDQIQRCEQFDIDESHTG